MSGQMPAELPHDLVIGWPGPHVDAAGMRVMWTPIARLRNANAEMERQIRMRPLCFSRQAFVNRGSAPEPRLAAATIPATARPVAA